MGGRGRKEGREGKNEEREILKDEWMGGWMGGCVGEWADIEMNG